MDRCTREVRKQYWKNIISQCLQRPKRMSAKQWIDENSIWDGQSLIDKSIMGEYDNKEMLLLRIVMFKSCCFNCNIQQWFKDNEAIEVTDMFGQTHPAKDIKLITTPSSIKYNKFGSDNWFEEWCSMINKQFGIVKYEKPTKHEKGTMVRTHYQLMNTINLTREELKEVMKPSIDRINEVISDADQMLDYCLNYVNQDSLSIQTKKERAYNALTEYMLLGLLKGKQYIIKMM